MDTSIFMAKILGIYLIILSLFGLLNQKTMKTLAREFSSQKSIIFLAGNITLLIGLIMVLSHNIWVYGWPVIITIFGWMILVGGLVRIFFIEKIAELSDTFLEKPALMNIFMAVYLLIGIFLVYKAWF